jgi:hypothetical protein
MSILGYPILNRDFVLPKDGWYHIAPIGTFHHEPSGMDQVIDKESIASMVDTFHEEEKAAGPHWPGILVDFDHFSHDTDKPTMAAGWIEDLQGRPDGLWGLIHWSDLGEAAVRGGRYRLISPVWNVDDCKQVDKETIKPMKLHRVAVTNDPNIKGMVPMSNRMAPSSDEEVPIAAKRPKGWRKSIPQAPAAPVTNLPVSDRLANRVDLTRVLVKPIERRPDSRRAAVSTKSPLYRLAFRREMAPSICNSVRASLLKPHETKLLERDKAMHEEKKFHFGDKDCAPVPLHLPDENIVREIFMKAVQVYLDQGMDYKAAWLKAKENNPSAYRHYSA